MDRKEISGSQRLGLGERLTTQEHREVFVGDGTILYFGCCGVYMTICIWQKLSELNTKKGEFHCM